MVILMRFWYSGSDKATLVLWSDKFGLMLLLQSEFEINRKSRNLTKSLTVFWQSITQ